MRNSIDTSIEVEKFRALQKMAGSVAHDFNNLATGVMAYSSMLREEYASDSNLSRSLQMIEDAAMKMSTLTAKLSTFSKVRSNFSDSVDFGRIAKKCQEYPTPSSIVLESAFADHLDGVLGDQERIEEVVLALLANSIEAMPNGGTVVVSARKAQVGKKSFVKISVRDQGKGIPKADQVRIFDPLFSTKQVGTSAGLGLSLVAGIIHNHRGMISFESAEGRGTRFNVYLPIGRTHPRSKRKRN